MRVALTTHVNADGDGCGSMVALWHLLMDMGVRAAITNPTPFPKRYSFLLDGADRADKSGEAVKHLERADAVIVLDISDLGRLGHLGRVVEKTTAPVACIDHHASVGTLPEGPWLVDPMACATGELVYDLAQAAGWQLNLPAAKALYVAMVTDTGGFRFGNTTPRAMQVAAHLLAHGLNPEELSRQVYYSESEGKVRLIGAILETLVVEQERGLAWITVPDGALKKHGLRPDDLEGIVDYPRSVEGVKAAVMFRSLANGRIKVSFRSVGDVDVGKLAEGFGGGGHRNASGASFEGNLADVQQLTLTALRDLLDANESGTP
jgi:phosphoesterase RecJ-like protein